MDVQQKRILFRANHRGTREADRLLGGFAKARLPTLSVEQVAKFESLLEENDVDILLWIQGLRPIPNDHNHEVMAQLIEFKNAI